MALFISSMTQEDEICAKKGSRNLYQIYVLLSDIVWNEISQMKASLFINSTAGAMSKIKSRNQH